MATFPTRDEEMIKGQRAAKDIPFLQGDETWVKDVNDLIEQHNFLSRNLSLQSNFNGQMVTVSFIAGEEKTIAHSLGIIPAGRIILRQEGNGVIDDIPSDWTKNSIKLRNNGVVSVTATIMIVRE